MPSNNYILCQSTKTRHSAQHASQDFAIDRRDAESYSVDNNTIATIRESIGRSDQEDEYFGAIAHCPKIAQWPTGE